MLVGECKPALMIDLPKFILDLVPDSVEGVASEDVSEDVTFLEHFLDFLFRWQFPPEGQCLLDCFCFITHPLHPSRHYCRWWSVWYCGYKCGRPFRHWFLRQLNRIHCTPCVKQVSDPVNHLLHVRFQVYKTPQDKITLHYGHHALLPRLPHLLSASSAVIGKDLIDLFSLCHRETALVEVAEFTLGEWISCEADVSSSPCCCLEGSGNLESALADCDLLVYEHRGLHRLLCQAFPQVPLIGRLV